MAYLESAKSEYLKYRALAESAIAQVEETNLNRRLGTEGNTISVIVRHIAGNLKARFTDFLTTDGEKPWRHRDQEFIDDPVSKEAMLKTWESGWSVLFETLEQVGEEDLEATVTIRGKPLSVVAALNRSLCHVSYHVGQLVLLARAFAGADWNYLSIPPGRSEEYNKGPAK